jgi:hypothetical protein
MNTCGSHIDDLTVTTGNSETFLNVGVGCDPSVADIRADQTDTAPAPAEGAILSAAVPLGTVFCLQLVTIDPNGNRIPVQSTFALDPANPTPKPPKNALWPNNVVIGFDETTQARTKFFQAIHLGNVAAKITPADQSIKPFEIRINVEAPASLGSSETQYDPLFVRFANKRGIPPQILKGLAYRESALKPKKYRYEPIRDFVHFSSGESGCKHGCLLILKEPYRSYALDNGSYLKKPHDISPRNKYCIMDTGGARYLPGATGPIEKIEDSDTGVTALNIVAQNDRFLFGSVPCPNQNWGANARLSVVEKIWEDPLLLDFTAQTAVSASYGLMQMTYETAVEALGWGGRKSVTTCKDDASECDPSYLFDTDDNLQNSGGSVPLGSDYLRRLFHRKNPGVDIKTPHFASWAELNEAFYWMVSGYNPRPDYPAEVFNFSGDYLPVQEGNIFP